MPKTDGWKVCSVVHGVHLRYEEAVSLSLRIGVVLLERVSLVGVLHEGAEKKEGFVIRKSGLEQKERLSEDSG